MLLRCMLERGKLATDLALKAGLSAAVCFTSWSKLASSQMSDLLLYCEELVQEEEAEAGRVVQASV